MSRTVIRYEGEGKARRPVYADQGPANGSAGSSGWGGHAEIAKIAQAEASRLVEVGGRTPDGGAGKIERSMATEAQRAAWRTTAPATADSPIARVRVSELERRRQSAHRGGQINRAKVLSGLDLRAASRAIPLLVGPVPPPEEKPVMAVEPEAGPDPAVPTRTEERIVALQALQEAALEAQEAVQELHAADVAQALADERWWLAQRRLQRAQDAVQAVLGPEDPVALDNDPPPPEHLPAQSIELADGTLMRAHSDGEPETIAALRELGEAAVSHVQEEAARLSEPADDAPDVVTRPARPAPQHQPFMPVANGSVARPLAATGGKGLPHKQARILAAVVRLNGDRRAASAELHIPVNNIENQLELIGRKGLLPAELFAVLPARFAKYATAAR